jgi:hypothetical protein
MGPPLGKSATVLRAFVPPWGTAVGPSPRCQMYTFANFFQTTYFCKIEEEKCKKSYVIVLKPPISTCFGILTLYYCGILESLPCIKVALVPGEVAPVLMCRTLLASFPFFFFFVFFSFYFLFFYIFHLRSISSRIHLITHSSQPLSRIKITRTNLRYTHHNHFIHLISRHNHSQNQESIESPEPLSTRMNPEKNHRTLVNRASASSRTALLWARLRRRRRPARPRHPLASGPPRSSASPTARPSVPAAPTARLSGPAAPPGALANRTATEAARRVAPARAL